MLRTALILFAFGALVGNVYNSFHAFSGTIPITAVHSNPLLDWRSYLLFGFAGLSIGMLTLLFDRLRKKTNASSWPKAIGAIALLGVFYLFSACTFLSNTAIFIILLFGFMLSWALYDKSGDAILAAMLVAIVGSAAEIAQVHYESYQYARPEVLGVTYWLPLLYCIASITTGQLARASVSASK